MKYSKHNLIEKCLQLIENSDETYEQLMMKRSVRGDDEFPLTDSSLKSKEHTGWLFGFLYCHLNDNDLSNIILYGFKRNWFYHENDDITEDIMRNFLFDIIFKDNDKFSDFSDIYMKKYSSTELSKDLLSVKSATGLTKFSFGELRCYGNQTQKIS